MTISSANRKAGPYVGNGTAATFPFSFKVFSGADLEVVQLNESLGAETILTITTNYTVALNPDQDSNPGGSVTLVAGPLATGFSLTLTSNLDLVQPTDITNQGGFFPEVIEDSLDRSTIQVQQLAEELGRTVRIPISSTASTALPFPKPNAVLGWNVSGTALQNVDMSDIGTQLTYGDWVYQTWTGNGTQAQFALTGNPGSLANMDVSINGIAMMPATDYSVASSLLTFAVPPANGDQILARYGRSALQQMTTYVEETVTATAGQTVFTLTNTYVPGTNSIQVYANGLRLVAGVDFIENSPTQVTLTSGATLGDELVFTVGTALNQGTSGTLVSFTPIGSGAVSRNVQDKLREVVSVTDFGADPTGANDSTAAFQAAIAVNPVKVIEIPPGTYKIGSPIILRDGLTLRGSGRTSTVLQKGNFNDACLKGIDVDQVTLEDFAIVGPGQWVGTGNKGILIAVSAQDICTSISMSRIDLSLLNDICVYVGSGAFCTYDNIRCRTYGYAGIFIDGGDGHALYACTTRGMATGGHVGFLINKTAGFGPTTVTMLGCYAEQAGRGIWFKGAISCIAVGCGVEAAINFGGTVNGTNWTIDGDTTGSNVTLLNCLSRNDTIGTAVAAPHVVVSGNATQTLIDGFTVRNHPTFAPPTWELDVTAGVNVALGRNDFNPARINIGSSPIRYTRGAIRYESAVQSVPAGYGGVSVNHGGPSRPDMMRAVLRRNAVAGGAGSVDASYATGDEVELADSILGSNHVTTTWSNATALGYGQVIAPPNIAFKTPAGVSTANANISTTCWGIVFYAYWF
jgi:hypothetical protein